MDNFAIADNFSLLGKLVDIHGDDSFKAKTYSATAFTIEKLPVQLSALEEEKIFAIRGIGSATGKKILEQLHTGRLSLLDEYIGKTPSGIFDLMKIKGLGPKKISTIWKELGIESLGELLYACEENRLLLYKGFGAKTQQSIQEAIQFFLASKGCYLYSQIENYAVQLTGRLSAKFPGSRWEITGEFRRHAEVINKLEWITDMELKGLESYFKGDDYEATLANDTLEAKGPENVLLQFFYSRENDFASELFKRTAAPEFFNAWKEKYGWDDGSNVSTEQEMFDKENLPYIQPYLRETEVVIALAEKNSLPEVIELKDIRGIIHSHSNWSDGGDTIETMAEVAIASGMEFLVISDHSQSAFYANGLNAERIKAQHLLIDELNERYKPFKIFKSIESDILNDGNLDYPDEVLATFDLVITSIHSNFKMTEEKAIARLLKAISNPYTTILGHMTGRLLLSRNGYPVDHDKVIEACARHNVVIELNAHPRRLDIDWRQLPKVIESKVLISIDPDAHTADAFTDVRYGVLAAQKGGLTAKQNLSSFTLAEFEAFLQTQRSKKA